MAMAMGIDPSVSYVQRYPINVNKWHGIEVAFCIYHPAIEFILFLLQTDVYVPFNPTDLKVWLNVALTCTLVAKLSTKINS